MSFHWKILKKEFTEYISNSKSEWEKRETKEKEKRQLMETERLKKEESRKKEMEEQRKLALETFEKRIKDNLKKQQVDYERRQKELEEIRQKEVEARKKNIEFLMVKKAEREKKRIRTRVHRQESKRLKDDLYVDEIKDKEESKRQKLQETKPNKNQETQSAGIKSKTSLSNLISMPVNSESVAIGQKKEPESPEKEFDGSDAEKQKDPNVKNQELSKQDSHRNSLQIVNQQYFLPPAGFMDSPREIKKGQNLTASLLRGDSKAKLLSESTVVGKARGRERQTDSFKLPSIQKAGPAGLAQKLSQSPYMRESDEFTSIKFRIKKDNKENIKVVAKKTSEKLSNTQFSPYKTSKHLVK